MGGTEINEKMLLYSLITTDGEAPQPETKRFVH